MEMLFVLPFVLPVVVTKLNWFWFQLAPTRFSCLDRPVRQSVGQTDRPTDRPARPRAEPRAVQSQTIWSRLPRAAAKNQRIWSFAMQDLVVLAIRTDHLFCSCSALEAVILRLLKLWPVLIESSSSSSSWRLIKVDWFLASK